MIFPRIGRNGVGMVSEMESTFTKKEIQAKINDRFWYHRIDLPYGLRTSGTRPAGIWHRDFYRIPERLDGMRVLDVGAWDGYWTFEALRRGAKQVLAIDDFSDLLGTIDDGDRATWENFDTIKKIFAYSDDQCQRHELCLYDLKESHFGRFDVVFCFGVLYHLRHPLLGLDVLSAVCDQAIYVESIVCDNFSPYNSVGYPGTQMVMEFYPNKEYSNNASNWWAPTLPCLANMVKSAGFANIELWPFSDGFVNLQLARGAVHGHKPNSALKGFEKRKVGKVGKDGRMQSEIG